MKIGIRPQRVYDAKRFYEILNNPNFKYFPVRPKSIEEEKAFLRLNPERWREKSAFNFSIIYNQKHVGGIGLRIDSFRSFIGELGYFIDEKYWGRGITTQAVRLLEDFIIANLNLHRIEIRMAIQNKASQKIAIKCGYKKEGILRESNFINGKWYDSYLYSKIL